MASALDNEIDHLVDQYLQVGASPTGGGGTRFVTSVERNAGGGTRPLSQYASPPVAVPYLEEYTAEGRSISASSTGVNSAYRRICLWANRKHFRLEKQRNEAAEREMAQCSFTPNTNTSERRWHAVEQPSPLYRDNRAWGYDEFITRHEEARTQREAQKRFEEEFWGSPGDKWRPHTTIPEPFELGRPLKFVIKSLESPYQRVAPVVKRQPDDVSSIEPPSVPTGLFSMKSSTAITQHSPSRNRPPA